MAASCAKLGSDRFKTNLANVLFHCILFRYYCFMVFPFWYFCTRIRLQIPRKSMKYRSNKKSDPQSPESPSESPIPSECHRWANEIGFFLHLRKQNIDVRLTRELFLPLQKKMKRDGISTFGTHWYFKPLTLIGNSLILEVSIPGDPRSHFEIKWSYTRLHSFILVFIHTASHDLKEKVGDNRGATLIYIHVQFWWSNYM